MKIGKRMTAKLLLAGIIIASCEIAFAQPNAGLDFKSTLQKHLNAITNRNLNGIAATVSDSVTLIFPDGELLQSKEKFVAFHKNWFDDKLWKMTILSVSTKESSTLSHALVKYHYIETNNDKTIKSESHTYLLLIFSKEKSGWRLLHDQNTKITL